MAAVLVTTTINGDAVEFACPPEESLLDALRNRLGLTGVKEGCGTGDCGACSVTLEGRLVCSCLVLGVEAEGREIATIEGMAEDGKLHPLQDAFSEHHALQCGYCTPGMLMSACHLLETNANPTDYEIRKSIQGNLCRCTGYANIIKAISSAAGNPQEDSNGH